MQELTTPFEEQDLVWAKIENYPWWPGKIIEIFEQKKSLFFKISFYADPTYCYLKEEALIPFQQFEQKLNANFSIDSQLQKAISLANNAFQRKKQLQQKQKAAENQSMISQDQQDQQIDEEHAEKSQQFQQSTIHVDIELENANRNSNKQNKSTQMKNLLARYKLDRIPKLIKHQKFQLQEKVQEQNFGSLEESDDQEKAELFDIKNTQRGKLFRGKNKKKSIIKRRKINSYTNQQRKIQFMKRLCALLITKRFESEIARQITIKVVQKTEQITVKNVTSQPSMYTSEEIYVKIMSIISQIDPNSLYQDKIVQIFNSADSFLYGLGDHQKQEQEKTHLAYVQPQQMQILC